MTKLDELIYKIDTKFNQLDSKLDLLLSKN
jgi:hypothetical protein